MDAYPFTTPKKLTSKILWKYWLSVQLPLSPIPALRCRKSSFVPALSMVDFRLDQSLREATSIWWASTLPLLEMLLLASLRADEWLSTRCRFMPWLAHSFATAKPTPLAAPVMRAVLPDAKTAVAGDMAAG